MTHTCAECGSPAIAPNGQALCICDGPGPTAEEARIVAMRCGGAGEIAERISPRDVDPRDSAFKMRELPCPGCPDCTEH